MCPKEGHKTNKSSYQFTKYVHKLQIMFYEIMFFMYIRYN